MCAGDRGGNRHTAVGYSLGGTMHARVSSYEGDVDALIEGFRRQADLVRQLDGFARAFLLVDRAAGRAVTVTLWDFEEALAASASRAAHLRDEASETAGATIGSVDSYEVALEVKPRASPLTSTSMRRASCASGRAARWSC